MSNKFALNKSNNDNVSLYSDFTITTDIEYSKYIINLEINSIISDYSNCGYTTTMPEQNTICNIYFVLLSNSNDIGFDEKLLTIFINNLKLYQMNIACNQDNITYSLHRQVTQNICCIDTIYDILINSIMYTSILLNCSIFAQKDIVSKYQIDDIKITLPTFINGSTLLVGSNN